MTSENLVDKNVKKVSLQTIDGVKIVGNYYLGTNQEVAFILVHMRPKTKESWDELAKFLQQKGYSSLAIDLRGHGESVESVKGILDYQKMSENEERESILDLEAASLFLTKEGFGKNRQILIGASIGANLSFEMMSIYPEILAAVLLSPGDNYRGIILENYKDKVDGQKILTIVAKDDLKQALNAVDLIKSWYPTTTVWVLEKGGHGTDILVKNPELLDKIYFWLKEKISLLSND